MGLLGMMISISRPSLPFERNTMTRSDLFHLLADRGELSRQQARFVIKTIFGDMAEALIRGEKVEIRG